MSEQGRFGELLDKLIADVLYRGHVDEARAAVVAAYEEASDGWHRANGVADLAMKHRDIAEAEAAALRGASLLLVDLVWQSATDSEEVPSPIHAKRLIDLALASRPPALAARPDTAKEKDNG